MRKKEDINQKFYDTDLEYSFAESNDWMIGLINTHFLYKKKITQLWSLNIWTDAAKGNFSQVCLIVLYWF